MKLDNKDISTLEEVTLLGLARAGSSRAFGELWQRHQRSVIASLRPLCRSEVEDIASESFTIVWSQMKCGGGPRTHFRAYVLTVAKRLSYRTYRERSQFVPACDMDIFPLTGTEEQWQRIETINHILAALNKIPARWSEVLWLHSVEGRTRAELCEKFGLSPNSVSALTRRARIGFKKAYQDATAA